MDEQMKLEKSKSNIENTNSFSKEKKVRMAGVLTFFLAVILAVGITAHFIAVVRKDLADSAYKNMKQTMGQIATTINATWNTDASNILELASVLSNTENKDTVMQGIKKNDIVHRYVLAENTEKESIASDGMNVQRDDSHSYMPQGKVEGVEESEAFMGQEGEWCYLLRSRVKNENGDYGWIYAQYLFERVDVLFPDTFYEGQGNCLILDAKTDRIVYQLDAENYDPITGYSLADFVRHVLQGSADSVKELYQAMLDKRETMISEKMIRGNTLIYVVPMGNTGYYLVGIASEAAVMSEADDLRSAVISVLLLLGIIIVGFILGSYIYHYRRKIRLQIEQDKERHHKELQEAYDAVNIANQAKSNFLSNMSHEIRTPINAVMGMNEMILHESNLETIHEYSKDIDDASQALLRVINDILDMTKIETGKIEIVPVEYEIKRMAQELRNIINVYAQKKNLKIYWNLDTELPYKLMGDTLRIRQILINLLSNAVKFTEQGRITVSVNGRREGQRVLLQIAVKDTGIGIKPEDIEKLKERFTVIEETKNKNTEGTGLGISITMELLKLMDSELIIESEFGKGSKFSFALWQDIVDSTSIQEIDLKEQAEQEAMEKKSARDDLFASVAEEANVLVVDDNKMNRKVMTGLLKQFHIVPDNAESGMECLEMIKDKKYDLIFMDHMMPQLDGVETFQRIRETEGLNKETHVIALTANAVSGAREYYLGVGFDEYMSKPVDIKILEQMLKRFL